MLAREIEQLPDLWRVAYAKDRLAAADYADPAPERKSARLLMAFIAVGLVFLALPGTFLGVWNLIAIANHHSPASASAGWIQAHGQAQLMGWVGTFVLGISLYVLPKFRGRPLQRFGLAWLSGALWSLGVAWRWWVGVYEGAWRVGLIASTLLELAAYLLIQFILFRRSRGKSQTSKSKGMPRDLGSWLGISAFLALGVALVLNLGIAIRTASHGLSPVYPTPADRVLVLLELWGFAVPVAWSYSTKFVTVFLGLEQPLHEQARWLCPGIASIVILSAVQLFWLADVFALGAVLLALWSLRIFHPTRSPPKLAGAYRHYPGFVRAAYLWLVVGAALGLMADVATKLTGLGGASRHAVTVGFLATLIFAVGPRILPSFVNGRQLFSRTLMGASLWLLNLGCFMRVASEAVAYSAGGLAWRVLPVSAFLELGAVIVFVVNMAVSFARRAPAWLSPEEVKPDLPLHWYVTSFPGLRPALVRTGLKTLASVRDIPRSLSLRQAAAADRAPVEELIEQIRRFFAARQPRRFGRPL